MLKKITILIFLISAVGIAVTSFAVEDMYIVIEGKRIPDKNPPKYKIPVWSMNNPEVKLKLCKKYYDKCNNDDDLQSCRRFVVRCKGIVNQLSYQAIIDRYSGKQLPE